MNTQWIGRLRSHLIIKVMATISNLVKIYLESQRMIERSRLLFMNLNLNNESGFTLLEALIALMMTSSILLLLVGGLLQANTINQKVITDSQHHQETKNTVAGDRQIEWHLFLNQLENYLQDSFNPVANNGHLEVSEIDEKTNRHTQVIYRQPDSGSRRSILQYKNNGNIRMLTGVERPEFIVEEDWLILNFKFRNGEIYTGRIWIESWAEEDNG